MVTPYFEEPTAFLRQAHESVLAQTHPCRHIMVADGRPNPEVDTWDVDHLVLSRCHADYGSTPRFVGAAHAVSQGFDLVAFLDADNWCREDHVERLARLQEETGAAFVSCGRILCRLDGSVLAPCPLTDPEHFVDTSCMAFAREGFPLLTHWVVMPEYARIICDRWVFEHVKASGAVRAHSPEPTLFYRCGKAGIYAMFGEPVPPGVSAPPDYQPAIERLAREGGAPLD